jgi:hypothetical protein
MGIASLFSRQQIARATESVTATSRAAFENLETRRLLSVSQVELFADAAAQQNLTAVNITAGQYQDIWARISNDNSSQEHADMWADIDLISPRTLPSGITVSTVGTGAADINTTNKDISIPANKDNVLVQLRVSAAANASISGQAINIGAVQVTSNGTSINGEIVKHASFLLNVTPLVQTTFVTTQLSITANGGTYNGNAFEASIDTFTGHDPAAVSFTYYAGTDTSGPALSGAPVSAGTYTVVANYAGTTVNDTNYSAAQDAKTFTIQKATLVGSAVTQAALNIAKNGDLAWAVTIDQSSIVDGQSVADLMNGAAFKLTINGVDYAASATATVQNGIIYVSWKMDAALKDALDDWVTSANTSASKAANAQLAVSATSNDNNYSFSDDFWTKLFMSLK